MPSSRMDTTTPFPVYPFCQAGATFISRPSLAPPFYKRESIQMNKQLQQQHSSKLKRRMRKKAPNEKPNEGLPNENRKMYGKSEVDRKSIFHFFFAFRGAQSTSRRRRSSSQNIHTPSKPLPPFSDWKILALVFFHLAFSFIDDIVFQSLFIFRSLDPIDVLTLSPSVLDLKHHTRLSFAYHFIESFICLLSLR